MDPNPELPNQGIKLVDWDPTERKVVLMLLDEEVTVRRLTDEELKSPERLRDDYYKRETIKFYEESKPSIQEGDEDRLVFMRTALACYILNWYLGPHIGPLDPIKVSWHIYVDYKGYTHQISDLNGWEINIDIISMAEPPQDVVKELQDHADKGQGHDYGLGHGNR
jgi:hypothetical protein